MRKDNTGQVTQEHGVILGDHGGRKVSALR